MATGCRDQGLALIVEANGDLVASSSPTPLCSRRRKIRRANINELDHQLASHLHAILSKSPEWQRPIIFDITAINTAGTLQVDNDTSSRNQHLGENYGLDWYLITAVRPIKVGCRAAESFSS